MTDTIVITERVIEPLEVVSPGPQGPPGPVGIVGNPINDGKWLRTLGGALTWDDIVVADVANAVATNDGRLSDARVPLAHNHPIADIVGLQATLDAKAAVAHTHAITDVVGLQAALDAKEFADGSYAAAATIAYGSRVVADPQQRFNIGADGKLSWGSGALAVDANLYRSAASLIKTDGAIVTNGGQGDIAWGKKTANAISFERTGGSGVLNLYATDGNTLAMNFTVNGTPAIKFGTAGDATISRTNTGELTIGSSLQILRTAGNAFYIKRTGDAANRFQSTEVGIFSWGDGTLAQDTNLYRAAADVLKTDDAFQISRSSVGSQALETFVAGDANIRYRLWPDGKMEWGDGTLARDTNLYRSAADVLKTDDTLLIAGGLQVQSAGIFSFGASGNSAFRAAVNGDAVSRITVSTAGAIQWGDGASSVDTTLLRISAGQLQVTNRLAVTNASIATAFSAIVSGDTNSRFLVNHDGQTFWGPGNAAVDTNLYRSAADTLKTDDTMLALEFQATNALRMNGNTGGSSFLEGIEQSPDPTAPAVNRGRLFFKDNGAGKTQLAVRFNTGATIIIATEP